MIGLFIAQANTIEAYTVALATALFGLYAISWLEKQRENR